MLAKTIIEMELSGVLGWALEGLLRLQRRGGFDPVMPNAMVFTLQEAKADTNSVVAWLADCETETMTDCSTPKEQVFEHYRGWCSASAMREVSAVQFWKRMKSQLKDLEEVRTRINGQQRRMCNVRLGSAMPTPWKSGS